MPKACPGPRPHPTPAGEAWERRSLRLVGRDLCTPADARDAVSRANLIAAQVPHTEPIGRKQAAFGRGSSTYGGTARNAALDPRREARAAPSGSGSWHGWTERCESGMVRHIQSGRSTGCVGSTLRGETGPGVGANVDFLPSVRIFLSFLYWKYIFLHPKKCWILVRILVTFSK